MRSSATFVSTVAVAAALAGCSTADLTPVQVDGAPRSSTNSVPTTLYSDGTYNAEGEYGNLPSHIGVELTVAADMVTAVTVTPRATVLISLELQQAFAEAVPAVVVGRPLDGLAVDKLAGSSGTPIGFNNTLDQIRAQAREQE